jgi:hypothetical protein
MSTGPGTCSLTRAKSRRQRGALRIIQPEERLQPDQVMKTSILAYADLIRNATFGHVIDWSFFWLAEHIKRRGQWFLHRYARMHLAPFQNYSTKQVWTIVD